ncbi:MAG: hypothetical protein RLZZ01_2166, partial [Actinomycetota bacterium]
DLPDGCRLIIADDSGGLDGLSDGPLSTDGSGTTTPVEVADSIFGSLLDVLAANPQFSLLHQLARDSDVAVVLTGDDPITMFAPSDAAFDALPPDTVAQLRSDPVLLATVLRHHLVAGRRLVTDLPPEGVTTLDGELLPVERSDDAGTLTVGGARLVEVDVVAGNGVVHTIDRLLLPADVELDPVAVSSTSAAFDGEVFVLGGTVRSEDERSTIVEAATAAAVRVDDRLVVDADVGLDGTTAEDLAVLIRAVGRHLLRGNVGVDDGSYTVSGVAAGGPQRSAFEQEVAGLDVSVTITIAPPVSVDEAARLEDELNALVADDPITFATGSVRIDAGSRDVLEAVVRSLLRVDGVRVTVEGHTDSDGVAEDNRTLSLRRAESVRDALVELGLDPATVEARGFGSERPILVDGIEDKQASRRVEFRVSVS